MRDRRLSKVQRNQLAELATKKGFTLADFEWRESTNRDKEPISSFHHVPTNAHMTFDASIYFEYWLSWWPRFSNDKAEASLDAWEAQALPCCDLWLTAVAAEHEAVDMWAAARQERAWLTESPSSVANAAFTEGEREQVAQHLRTIETYVLKTYQLSEEQAANVRAQIGYLTQAVDRLGRFDWRGLAASTFISIVLQLGLTPDKASGLMNLASQLLGPLMTGAARLLGGT